MFGIEKLRERISSLELELGVLKIKHLEHLTLSNQRHKKAMKLAGYEPIKELIKKNWDGKECHKPFKIVGENGKKYDIRSTVSGGVLGYSVYIGTKLYTNYTIKNGDTAFDRLIQRYLPYEKQFSDDEYFKEVGK